MIQYSKVKENNSFDNLKCLSNKVEENGGLIRAMYAQQFSPAINDFDDIDKN